MILPKAVKRSVRATDEQSDLDTDEDIDDEDKWANEEKEDMYTSVGSLSERLKTIKDVHIGKVENRETTNVQRLFYKNIKDVIKNKRSKRMVIVIDRRMNGDGNQIEGVKNYSHDIKDKDRKHDDFYAFLPNNTQNIPSGEYLHESMCNLSRTEVLPSINGKVGDKDVIHTGSNTMEMSLLSIHVHEVDVVRAYWCRNGTVSRFYLNDMVRIWPYHFIEESFDEDKGIEYQDVTKVQELIQTFAIDDKLLRDNDFEKFSQINAKIRDKLLKNKK